jgi:hypothetical protein
MLMQMGMRMRMRNKQCRTMIKATKKAKDAV